MFGLGRYRYIFLDAFRRYERLLQWKLLAFFLGLRCCLSLIWLNPTERVFSPNLMVVIETPKDRGVGRYN